MKITQIESRTARTAWRLTILAILFAAVPSVRAESPPTPVIDRHGIPGTEVAAGHLTEIAAFLAADAKSMPAPGGVLFVGSSTIRLWKATMAEQFPDLPWINRGFGGGRTWETLYFFDEIVAPYKPRLIVYFCGTNDTVAAGHSPDDTVRNTMAFLNLVREKLPGTRVLYLTLTKSPARQNVWDKMDTINRDLAAAIKSDPHVATFDMNSLVFDKNGAPRMDLYLPDKLHFNAQGYAALTQALRPLIDAQFKMTEPEAR